MVKSIWAIFVLKGMKIVKNTKFFLVGMVSGMLVLKSIEMMMEKNNMSCKKAMNNFETKMKGV